MNFYQQRVARESAQADYTADRTELPADTVEGILAEVAEDTKDIDSLDSQGAVLNADAAETDATYQQVADADDAADAGEEGVEADMSEETVTQIDVAQESVRRRWGLDHRQTLARESYGASRGRRKAVRESLWEDIKAFFRRIWEWIKAQGRKLKDRWIKFRNQGKTIQKRSKQFDEAIRKLGTKKKDDISGSFIKQLSVGKEFIGSNPAKLAEELKENETFEKETDGLLKTYQDVVEMFVAGAGGANSLQTAVAASSESARAFVESCKEYKEHLGGLAFDIDESDKENPSVTVINSEADVETEVPTPAPSVLNSVNTFFNKLGVALEKRAIGYEKTNAQRDKIEKAIEKAIAKIDKIKSEEAEVIEGARIVRQNTSALSSIISIGERLQAHIFTCLSSGVNGYLSAGIAAYDKRK